MRHRPGSTDRLVGQPSTASTYRAVRVRVQHASVILKVGSWLQAWTLSNGLGNPASLYSNELRLLFDAAFRGDYSVRKSILQFEHDFLRVRALLARSASRVPGVEHVAV